MVLGGFWFDAWCIKIRTGAKKACENKNIGLYRCRFEWIDGRVVEGARLEIVCTSKGYREFESHSIRH